MFDRIVYLVRHGHYEPPDRTKEYVDVGLTTLGREQAAAVAERLRGINADAIYCSTLARACETAVILAKQFPALTLRESLLLRELPSRELPTIGPWDEVAWQTIFERGMRRGLRAFRYYVRPSQTSETADIVVTHGNLVRCFVCRALGMAPESWSAFGTSHCGITQLRVRGDGRVQVISYNDTGHLAVGLRS